MSKRARLGLSLALLVISMSSLFLFASWTERPADIAKAFPRGIIVVGVDASVPPFASDDGQAVYGLDIDLANAIARHINLPIRFLNIGYYGLYDALISGEVDILISALRVEEARMDDVRYTRHYFDNGLLLVTPADKAIALLDGLAGQKVAYEFGSGADTELRVLEDKNDPVTRLPYELPTYALDSLRLEYADAAIVDAITLRLYQRRFADWRTAQSYLTRDHYAIAARRDNRDAWRLVDGALAALKENGELDKIIALWL
ncbi:MAG: ABC transporter substrate-binding protein [Chloroflexi bacterium]|nr:ABC transporter substrate-binding protein [Chloroflexota bacterium]